MTRSRYDAMLIAGHSLIWGGVVLIAAASLIFLVA
jgi:hypothetical protein